MSPGICDQTFIPIRSAPDEKSEMVSQILFGEKYSVLEEHNNWLKITCKFDNYTGWIDRKYWFKYDDHFEKFIVNSFPTKLLKNNANFILTPGSEIPLTDSAEFKLGDYNYRVPGNNKLFEKCCDIEIFVQQFLYAPYLWGGRNFYGIDCSGLSQIFGKIMGVNIPRDASQQAKIGKIVSSLNAAQVGDLAFFENNEGNITHVGIVLEKNFIVHSSGFVRIDTLDEQGIFNQDRKTHTHKLSLVKRIL